MTGAGRLPMLDEPVGDQFVVLLWRQTDRSLVAEILDPDSESRTLATEESRFPITVLGQNFPVGGVLDGEGELVVAVGGHWAEGALYHGRTLGRVGCRPRTRGSE